MTSKDRALLRDLEEEIPPLEEKLRAMKVTRRRLKAAQTMAAKWKDPDFRKKAKAALRQRASCPEEQTRWDSVRYIPPTIIPWPRGTPQHKRYRSLRRGGWDRDGAIAKINLEARQQ